MNDNKKNAAKTIAVNKRARFEYHIEDRLEALDGAAVTIEQGDTFVEAYGLLAGDARTPRILFWNRVQK